MTDTEIVRAAGEAGMGWEFHEGSRITMANGCWYDDSGKFMVLVDSWNPLTSLSDAGMLIEAMRAKGFFLVAKARPQSFIAEFRHLKCLCKSRAIEPTLERAITLAALRKLEVPNAK